MTAEQQIETLQQDAVNLLRGLIQIQSYSTEEDAAADIIERFLNERDIPTRRLKNNLWVDARHFDESKPKVLLNSHLDTVQANANWTRDPFGAEVDGDALYGLGSNDAGGPLVSLLAAFLHYYNSDELPFNLMFAATAEEEISGDDGMVLAFPRFGRVDLAIIGEPSGMALTIAERGHMTLEVLARGKSGHAGREIGVNAITKALPDIQWFHQFKFPRESDVLGPVKMSVTKINAGTSSNAIPDECRFVVDVRTTDQFQNDEVFETIEANLENEVRPLARHLKASRLPDGHPLITAANSVGLEVITSPTSSDQGLIDVPSVKIGPGQSERSHTSDEFIRVSEIYDGIEKFIRLLSALKF